MSCIKPCVNTSKYSFCADFIRSVTAQMSYYADSLIRCKNLTENIIGTFRKNGFIKVKMPIKGKINLNLLEKD